MKFHFYQLCKTNLD